MQSCTGRRLSLLGPPTLEPRDYLRATFLLSQRILLVSGAEALDPSELELVVLCHLEMCAIAAQQLHSALATRIALRALKLLQASKLFSDGKNTKPGKR